MNGGIHGHRPADRQRPDQVTSLQADPRRCSDHRAPDGLFHTATNSWSCSRPMALQRPVSTSTPSSWTVAPSIVRAEFADVALITDAALFKLFGASKVVALDHSDYEKADIIHYLRTPLPACFHRTADLVVVGSMLDICLHAIDRPTILQLAISTRTTRRGPDRAGARWVASVLQCGYHPVSNHRNGRRPWPNRRGRCET